jgi:hypothetical protein
MQQPEEKNLHKPHLWMRKLSFLIQTQVFLLQNYLFRTEYKLSPKAK